MPPVQQKRRKSVNLVTPTRGRKEGGNTAGRNLHDSIPIGAKNNYAITIPSATEN
jgi:hypothetical protein